MVAARKSFGVHEPFHEGSRVRSGSLDAELNSRHIVYQSIGNGYPIDAGLPSQPSGFGNALHREGDPNFMHDELL